MYNLFRNIFQVLLDITHLKGPNKKKIVSETNGVTFNMKNLLHYFIFSFPDFVFSE